MYWEEESRGMIDAGLNQREERRDEAREMKEKNVSRKEKEGRTEGRKGLGKEERDTGGREGGVEVRGNKRDWE